MAACLHIGWPKTGTTHIQEWLKLNKLILKCAALSAISSVASHRLGVECLDADYGSRADIVQIKADCPLAPAMEEVRAAGGALSVISSEYFSLNKPALTARLFADAGIYVAKIICYLRRQDRLCASGYAQEIKALGASHRHNEVLYNEMLDWELLHERWSEAFPRAELVFLNYDAISREDRLIDSFQDIVGARQVDTKIPASDHNRSFGAEMTEVARLLNERGVAFDPARIEYVCGWYPGVPFGFSAEITALFEERFIASNDRFAARFAGRFDEFATAGWTSPGVDMTGKVSEPHLADILSHLEKVKLSAAG